MRSAVREPKPRRDDVLSLEVLARSKPGEDREQPTQFRVLVRHFLDRFFNNELASSEGDAKTRLVQVACTIGIPPFVVALYLYTPYHMPHQVRPYWAQAGDHYFYTLYSMVAMGIVTIFEWDLLFPDLLDVFVLSSLPVRAMRMLTARVAAIFILMVAALFDSSFLAPLVLPAAVDPPHLLRFWAAHLLAVGASGVFGAAFFLALEGILVGVLGDRLFRRIALWLQGASVVALLTLLFLYPALAGSLGALLQSRSRLVGWLPSFWFLGIDQRILDGPATPQIFAGLARTAWTAVTVAVALAVLSYPLAWWRKTRELVEGAAKRERLNRITVPLRNVLHAVLAPKPAYRAMWQFIGQNLLRVPRYRMVLVMYGGLGAALLFATVTRLHVAHGRVGLALSPEGLRASVPIVAFLTVSGLRSTFLAPADQRGRWIFRVTVGRAGPMEMRACQRWVFVWSGVLSLAAALVSIFAGATRPLDWRLVAGQLLVAIALSLLLTDVFFLGVKTIPFTGVRLNSARNFALLLIPYLGFFPATVMFTVSLERSIEANWESLLIAAAVVGVVHLALRAMHRRRMAEHQLAIEPDGDEEEFPLRLGLRY